MSARYAIYYAPAADSPLWRAGCAWLGRDPETDRSLDGPPVAGISLARWRAVTEAPRFYGFHATLKAPFSLKPEISLSALWAAAERFSKNRGSFSLALSIDRLGDFLALLPAGDSTAADRLANEALEAFEGFRAPLNEAELARRMSMGLTQRQEANLRRWGYPFVAEDFRFHMTLTGAIAEDAERDRLKGLLAGHFETVLEQKAPIDGIAIFAQSRENAPFRLLDRFAFKG